MFTRLSLMACCGALALVTGVHLVSPARAQEPARGVYHADPQHLWNRLHDALFVRDANGLEIGRDRVEPLLWRSSKHLLQGPPHAQLIAALDEFERQRGEQLISDPLKRALLQRDVWLVFSWLEHSHDEFRGFRGSRDEWAAARERLRVALARLIGRVAVTPAQIAQLPDTYALAIASGEFAARFELSSDTQPYLPAPLFAADGPWVSLGRSDGLIAPAHVEADNPFTNSVFVTFIKLPGGRAATLDYVERLRAYKGPMFVPKPSGGQGEFPHYDPAIPQFPAGTEVALVRRAMLVSTTRAIVPTTITEAVEVRVYREIPAAQTGDLFREMLPQRSGRRQAPFEFTLSRRRLFEGRSGGLEPDGDKRFLTGFSTHGVDVFEEGHVARLPSETEAREHRRTICITCHALPGVYSFNTFAQQGTARRSDTLMAMPVPDVIARGVQWKERRPEWLLLRQLLSQQ